MQQYTVGFPSKGRNFFGEEYMPESKIDPYENVQQDGRQPNEEFDYCDSTSRLINHLIDTLLSLTRRRRQYHPQSS